MRVAERSGPGRLHPRQDAVHAGCGRVGVFQEGQGPVGHSAQDSFWPKPAFSRSLRRVREANSVRMAGICQLCLQGRILCVTSTSCQLYDGGSAVRLYHVSFWLSRGADLTQQKSVCGRYRTLPLPGLAWPRIVLATVS